MKNFLREYKKMLTCLVFLLILCTLQYLTGRDLSEFTNQVIGLMITLLGAGIVKYSVLKTSERDAIKGEVQKESYRYPDEVTPEDFNPGYKRPTKQ